MRRHAHLIAAGVVLAWLGFRDCLRRVDDNLADFED